MKQKWIWLLLLILSFTFGVAFTAFADAEYSDDRFSIKDVPIYVNIMDDARDGCWTNIGEVRTYIEDKLSEQGAVVADSVDFAVALNFRILATRWVGTGWCFGSMTLSLGVQAVVPNTDLEVYGNLYRKHSIDVEPQNFNISALTWLGEKLPELD